MMRRIDKQLSARLKAKPRADQLGFGFHFTDHMFIMDYEAGRGWHRPRIVPYQPLTLDPAAKVLHYSQTVFEGLKAYSAPDGRTLLFRPHKNFARLIRSCERLGMPPIDPDTAMNALRELIRLDRGWIPAAPGTSLYIRPFMFATEAALGVAPSASYTFVIIMSPVAAYYAEGMNPVRILVEPEYVRAVRGGLGEAKTGGNYAAGLKAQELAKAQGCTQVLWLDGVERRYIEEVGSMNVFFKIAGTVLTPQLGGSILDGVTRDSVIALLRDWGVPVTERSIAIDDVRRAWENGELEEAFGTGTAAVVSPIGELDWRGGKMIVADGRTGELTRRLYREITAIQYGTLPDKFGWTMEI